MRARYHIRALTREGTEGTARAFASNLTRNEILAGHPVYLAAKEREDRKESRSLEVGPVYRDGDFKASRPQDL